jgi:glycosyltransferase involved in cell wall biosynthesis
MHVLFLHQNFPAQFGPLLLRLAGKPGWRFSYLHRSGDDTIPGVEKIRYTVTAGATKKTHEYARTFENIAGQSSAAAAALLARPDVVPDLIVSHSGFVSAVPLLERLRCPGVAYLEYYYHTVGADMDFRPDQQPTLDERARARFRNAPLLMDLDAAAVGLSPTHWQRDRFPLEVRGKIEVVFDGFDPAVWRRRPPQGQRKVGRVVVPDDVELVTYASRGFEAMRGFDRFMAFAKALYTRRPKVRFFVVGSDKVSYGADLNRTGGKTFREWVLAQDEYDRTKFVFANPMPPENLAELFSVSDLHVYLTAPFVLSWSLLNAMACGAPILASDTPPVREAIDHERCGLLAGFFDTDAMVRQAERALDDRAFARSLGEAAAERARERYTLDVTVPRHVALFEKAASRRDLLTPDSSPPRGEGG